MLIPKSEIRIRRSMRKVKILILIVIVLIAGVVLTSLWRNFQGKKGLEGGGSLAKISPGEADMHLEKIRLVEDKHGQKTWELEAKAIHRYQAQNILMLEDVKVTFYTKDGRTFTLAGEKGKIHQDSKDMELVGDVVLTTSDGYCLKTHSMSYKHANKKATTSDPVEIEGKEMRVVGRGMLLDMEAKVIRILSQVKTRWKGREEG